MAAISIRGLDDEVKRRLRVHAARHGRSMEAEARGILTESVHDGEGEPKNLLVAGRDAFAALGGVDLKLPPRQPMRPPPDLSDW
ncbi:MAG: FitA-like ribbon-helix-helix domain-containing protein [Candidatus Dormibacteraceae bacterium]